MKKLNVAIIGCGVVSNIHVDSLVTNKEIVVALCDIVLSKAQKLKDKFSLNANLYQDYIEMLDKEKIDVVHICTPHYLHAEMVIEALKRNINVLCEKPLAISFKQLKDIKEAVDSSKGKLGVCMQRRYEPNTIKMKEIYKDNKILSANATLSWCRDEKYYASDAWRGKKKTEGGGVMINQALHILDMVTYLMGKPDSVIAHTFNDSLKKVIDVEDAAYAIFKYDDGRRFLIEATNANNLSHEITICLKNNEHSVYYIGENLIVDDKQIATKVKITEAGKKEWGYGHQYLINAYYDALRNNKEFEIGFEEGAKVVKLILDVYKSKGREIRI